MIKHDYANRADKCDPVEAGDTLGNGIVCVVALFAFHYIIFWLAGGL